MKHQKSAPNFQKKKPDDLKMLTSEQNKFEHQSRQMVSSSIFPHPSSILPPFNDVFDDIKDKFFKIYPPRCSEDGEILLTRDQFEKLKAEILKEREEQLTVKYIYIKKDYICRYEKAMTVKALSKPDKSSDFDSLYS